MILVLGLAGLIWWGGRLMGLPRAMRGSLLALLFTAVVILQLTLPNGHGLRAATGGSASSWLILGGIVLLIGVYSWGVSRLRARAEADEEAEDGGEAPTAEAKTAAKPGRFSETELNRYARHIVLRELGGPGQKKLKNAKVLVIGAGGLGAPALQYLAAAGVGTIGVIDDDVVENANLQRQVIHRDQDIGLPKVFSAQKAMEAQNPFVTVRPYHRRLTDEIAADLFAEYDIILDGTDNFESRYLSNRTAVALGKPLISGALSQWEGQLSVFHPKAGGPCYQCIFPEAPAAGLAPSCSEAGVIGPLPGVVGAMMAVETIKQITGAGEVLRGAMLIYDALYSETRRIGLKQRVDCPICGAGGDGNGADDSGGKAASGNE
ncbi:MULTISPECIES: HesA/MoeB/ThiF family protein [Rhodobacterales]|jgi:molybdopterin/thiamine biosynthesis adenylyltransferase|uniref:HesA/MoeB/ThiF family protein n=1 Tax=Rhodobacterales TaxID=204455 RepID=UPI00237F8DE6|nr:HesA/MoeB/ThiF family protein [Phaeobacter gallaeciensis]MDE4140619.1 HesA/MoeB/ThiF family protein [Phaeobacter gallaeciensis]MDE4148688.1 HesA/MoeB/ThiF family protein [Phaeobacter gallaeciensis]MDE4152910.1 HesA/MoeB/ThiF family protein [Phaeobacter gallaeciensis]MDE4228676.1 HesA/MoeB/ThiF family protein [Phaeobacter gallaeciensis]MDE4257752.1 HesA/MoeB/ThiF family protein [Phaeobacter gallaeciensis]